ncbi:hypothetical protein [Oceanospirillum beijerinckii]|uniref:hypothetical protein n=1 Tax=Oceanospirillum beijerinckii TaxID=64976 RepID=UPI0012FE9DF3|nr:hypothetical protein [Oceanospirillum beijerinckii]
MQRIIYLIALLFLWPLTVMGQELFLQKPNDNQHDPLNSFRLLLSEQLNQNSATIERVFNPIGDGESLLVRAYVTGPEELVFRPLFSETADNAQKSSYVLRTLPGTEVKEVLINFEAASDRYQMYFGQFHYSVSPDMTNVSHISVRPESSPFLAENFQTLFIDEPAAALAIRYLSDQQEANNLTSIIQLRKEYRDSMTDQLLVDSNGQIVNPYRLIPYDSINIKAVYFLEEYNLDNNTLVRHDLSSGSIKNYQLNTLGQAQTQEAIPESIETLETPTDTLEVQIQSSPPISQAVESSKTTQ